MNRINQKSGSRATANAKNAASRNNFACKDAWLMSMDVIQKSFAMALRDYQAQRYVQAEALCQKILAFEPDHADALHLLGMIAYSSEHPEDAIDLIHQAI